MSSFLWRYFLENDAERFQHLLQRQQSGTHSSAHRGGASKLGHEFTAPPSFSKHGIGTKSRPGSPPASVIITKQMLRNMDSMGRSLLHLASSEPQRLFFLQKLLSHPLSDPAQVDMESGWNCLHRALWCGNISAAREILSANPNNWNLVKAKDHAGDTPFDVYAASIDEFESMLSADLKRQISHDIESETESENSTQVDSGNDVYGDEIFTWGSNKNLTLGFPDGDDRSFPERVPLQRPGRLLLDEARDRYSHKVGYTDKSPEELLDANVMFRPNKIVDVHLSKFHTAVLTDDPHSNLHICGFGNGGRLGFGEEQNTQFKLRPLCPPLLPRKKVSTVALGIDHTVAVLEDGEVWTWGGNRWGQLGYGVQQRSPQDEPIQATPRQVFGLLKKERAIGCAASKTHTAVFTHLSLYTFGKNDGQLGILDSSDARTLATQSTPRKVAANFLTGGNAIVQVVAIDKATIVLVDHREVWILAGYGYSKVSFPITRFVGLPSGIRTTTRYDSGSIHIRKITAGGDTVCALAATGDVFAVDVDATMKERAERVSAKVPWISQQAWSMRKPHMAVVDVDVGADGNIIICTRSGSVWRRQRRVKPKEGGEDSGRYKFSRVPGLTQITTVRSNTAGVFAAIRKDVDIMQKGLIVDSPRLWVDMARALSFARIFNKENTESSAEPYPTTYEIKTKQRSAFIQWLSTPKNKIVEDLKGHSHHLGSSQGLDFWDTTISTSNHPGLEIPVNMFLLGRCLVFRRLRQDDAHQREGIAEFIPGTDGRMPRIILHKTGLLALLNLVYFLYTDIWPLHGAHSNLHVRINGETLQLAKSLAIEDYDNSINTRKRSPKRPLGSTLRCVLGDENTTDMVIDLANEDSIRVHSTLMRVRCPFFGALYEGRAGGRWLMGRHWEDDGVHVDMTHVSKTAMDMVVSWLYTDWGTEGFDHIRFGVDENDVDRFLDFVLEVMSTANELLLGQLCQICQRVIGAHINTRNVAGLLNAVSECSEKGFQIRCLQYICVNMEIMLEHHLLDELDEDLMLELDHTIQEIQRRCYRYAPSNNQHDELLVKYPSLPEQYAREKAILISHYIAEAEDYVSLSSRRNLPVYSSSPSSQTPGSAKRKKAPRSPPVKPAHEDIFAMDSDDENLIPAKSPKGKATISPTTPIAHSPERQSTSTPNFQQPWHTPTPIKKLDMREIMAQASRSGKSALTAQLSSSFSPASSSYKVSQKERKRQQQKQQDPIVQAPEQPAAAAPWKIAPTSQTVSLKEVLAESSMSPTPPRPSPRPSPRPTSSRFPQPQPSPTPSPHQHQLKLSLQDIIDQETVQKDILKEYAAKRSLQEIQEEQEFMQWWESESLRVQAEAQRAERGKGGRGRGGRGRGRGGSGRGRARAQIESAGRT